MFRPSLVVRKSLNAVSSKLPPGRAEFQIARAGQLIAAAALAVGVVASIAASAQTAHFSGAVVTLTGGYYEPGGVGVDAGGNIFFTGVDPTTENVGVYEIVAAGGYSTVNQLASNYSFSNPSALAVDASGNVFTSDAASGTVYEILAPQYTTVKVLPSKSGSSSGIALDKTGNVFVSYFDGNAVYEIPAPGYTTITGPLGNATTNDFHHPEGLAIDGNGDVFVADSANGVVKEMMAVNGSIPSNAAVSIVATGFISPEAVILDGSGNLYVADGNAVKEILAVNGSIPPGASSVDLGSGFGLPQALAADASGNIFVADYNNNAVYEIQTAGVNFGSVNVGSTSTTSLSVTFTFDSGGTLGSTRVLTEGAADLDFSDAGHGSCNVDVAYKSGATCTVTVAFSPRAPGPRYGSAELIDESEKVIATGLLQGIGVAPQRTFATTSSTGITLPSAQFAVGTGFNQPYGVAVDAAENVFVADTANNQIKEITQSSGWNSVVTLAGGFNYPNSLAIDGSGNLYTADTNNNVVKEVVAGGGYTTVRTLGSGFSNPYGVAVDGSGNVYVADYYNGAVKEMLAVNGTIPATPTIRTLQSGVGATGVAVDGSGNVFVSDFTYGNVYEILAVKGVIPASPTIKTIASGLAGPSDLVVDTAGNVYVPDDNNNTVVELMAAGGYTTVLTLGTGFNYPNAVAVDAFGNVFVADSNNSTIDYLNFQTPPQLTFATTAVGKTSAPVALTVFNDGNAPLIFPLPSYGTSPSVPADVVWDAASTCVMTTSTSGSAFSLPAGAGCTMALDFVPSEPYEEDGFLEWIDNSGNNSENIDEVEVIGTGTPGSQRITFKPATPVAYGVSPITLTATGGASGNPVTFSIVSGPGSLSGNNNSVLAVTGMGTIVIAANQAANFDYLAAPTVTASILVTAPAAALVAPAPGALAGPSVSFAWNGAFNATGYYVWIGTNGVGSNNLYNSAEKTGLSYTFTNMPTTGIPIYVRLITNFSGTWVHNDYAYTAASASTITAPAAGSTFTGPSVNFTWTAATGATGYYLWIGSSGVGSNNLYNSAQKTVTSYTFNAMPTAGQQIYVRLNTNYNGIWTHNDYTYTAATASAITSPTAGSSFTSSSATFNWISISAATGYYLWIGTTGVGSNDLYNSAEKTVTTYTFKGLPTNGETIYVRINTNYSGVWVHNDYTYHAYEQPAVITSPVAGSTFTSASVPFTWTAPAGATGYYLWIGSTGAGSKDIYNSAEKTVTSYTFTNMPTNGEKIYVRLNTNYNGVWTYNDYTYIAK